MDFMDQMAGRHAGRNLGFGSPMPMQRPAMPQVPARRPTNLGFGAPTMNTAAAPAAAKPGIGARIMQGIRENPSLLMALGGQLMAHRQDANQPMVDPAGMMLGAKSDRDARDDERGKRAFLDVARAIGVDEDLAVSLRDAGLGEEFIQAHWLADKKTFRPATAEELEFYGAKAGQVGPNNQFHPVKPHGAGDDGAGVFGTPIYGTRDGKPAVGVIPKAGGEVQWLDTGGADVAPGTTWQDFGTYRQAFDNRTGQPVGPPVPKSGDLSGDQAAIPDPTAPGGVRATPVPGSVLDREQAVEDKAAGARRQGEVDRSSLLAEEIDRVITRMDTGTLPDTGAGAWLANVPGTDARAVAASLATIKANIGFDELNKMRQQSPTGGALGQVTERELAFLQSVAGNLDQSQSAQDLKDNLNRLWNAYQDVIHGEGAGPARRELSFRQQAPQGDRQDAPAMAAPKVRVYNPATGELE